MPKVKVSEQAIAIAAQTYEQFTPYIGHGYDRFKDQIIFTEIKENLPTNTKVYYKSAIKTKLKVSKYPFRYRGGLDVCLMFRFAVPMYVRPPVNGPYSYENTNTMDVIRDLNAEDWCGIDKGQAINRIAASVEGALHDEGLLSSFFVNKFVPLQSAVLDILMPASGRMWDCRILYEDAPFPHYPKPIKCLKHGEWMCRSFMQDWVKHILQGRDLYLKDTISYDRNGRYYKPRDLRKQIAAMTPLLEIGMDEISTVLENEDMKRRILMSKVKPLFVSERR